MTQRGASTFPLVIDDRELRGPMADALAQIGAFDIAVQRLALGDYLVDRALLFERKTLRDLVASIKEGRLFSQALRLAESGIPAALVLEGSARDLDGSGMRWEAIQGALVTVALSIGLPILRTRNAADTARTLLFAARQRATFVCGALQRRGKRPKGKAALQRHILQGLPRVGPHRAGRLLARFGSVQAVMAADAAKLSEVGGIGPKTARKIRWTVEEAPASYRCGRYAKPSRDSRPDSAAS